MADIKADRARNLLRNMRDSIDVLLKEASDSVLETESVYYAIMDIDNRIADLGSITVEG